MSTSSPRLHYLRDHTGGSRGVFDESEFAEVGAFIVVHDFEGLFPGDFFGGVGFSGGQEEEDVAFLALEPWLEVRTSWIMGVPAGKSVGLTASMILVISYGSMVEKIWTLLRNSSYFSRFLLHIRL